MSEPRPGDESDWSGWTRLPVARWLPDDRLELVTEAAFRDFDGEVWRIPVGFRCDLASFPFWPFWLVALATLFVDVPDTLTAAVLILGNRIPVDAADADVQQEPTRGFGIRLNNITPELERRFRLEDQRGAVIVEVEPESAAARRGLQPGDVITRVGRQPVQTAAEARDELARIPSGGTALLRVMRNGQETFVTVTKE